jgi:uncharacterized membrane protein YhhN
MTPLTWCALTGVALIVLLVAERLDSRPGIAVTKPIASTGFLGAAWAAGALESSYGQLIFVALVLSWLGDVLLIPKGAKRAFLAGLVAFLGGHVAYAAAFISLGLDPTVTAVTAVPLAIVAATVGQYLVRSAPEKLRMPVVGYIAVISIMVATAAGAVGAGASALVVVGAVIFYFSDLGVARDRFVQKSFWNKLVLLPLYYAAQLIFATSVP